MQNVTAQIGKARDAALMAAIKDHAQANGRTMAGNLRWLLCKALLAEGIVVAWKPAAPRRRRHDAQR